MISRALWEFRELALRFLDRATGRGQVDPTVYFHRAAEHGSSLRALLWQHPVGQGLFHSGRIDFEGRIPFRYVYDCGKYAAAKDDWPNLVGPVVTEYARRPLDALFISHFDVDHINGLTALLEGFGGATRAFLPYLSPPARLMVAAHDLARGASLDRDHLEFLGDPAEWLLRRGVELVNYVRGDIEPGGPIPQDPPPPGDDDNRGQRRGWINPRPADVHLRESPAAALGSFWPRDADDLRTKVLDHREPVSIRGAQGSEWTFQLYVDPDIEADDAVNSTVRRALGAQKYEQLVKGGTSCADLLADPKSRTSLAQAYREAMGLRSRLRRFDLAFPGRGHHKADRSRMNRSTMSLFSGPTSREDGRWPVDGSSDPTSFDS